jgi:phosphatidate phosphatase APP1
MSLFDRDPYHIVGYRGYATATRALVLGRVLEDERLDAPDPLHSKWRNLVAVLKRIESDPLPHARVRARLHGTEQELVADDEGFIHQWIESSPPVAAHGWHEVELELTSPAIAPAVKGRAPVLRPLPTAAYGVISDLDDTVLQSEVRNFLRAVRLMLFENARTRLPFPGVAAFYRALASGAAATNPIFYVSSSPWNLYDVIAEFLTVQEIPEGPVLLRDWDLGPSLLKNAAHKSRILHEILASYPALPFILVGDSGQEDPEIYSAIVREHPGRIHAVYIRNVSAHPERSAAIQTLATEVKAAGSTLVLADDTLAIARHAAEHGWIDERMLPEIGGEKRRDEGTSAGKRSAPGTEPPDPTGTIVIE